MNKLYKNRGKAIHLAKANHCQLSKKAIEFINGEMLGDGYLNSKSSYSARFQYTSKHWEYINYISKTLKSFGIEQSGKIYKYRTHNNNTLFPIKFIYVSFSYVELKVLYDKWYPNKKKIVPKDIKLIPITLRQWYIGDGNLWHFKNKKAYIILSTNAFPIEDVKRLTEQLNDLGFKATRQPYRNIIHIWVKSTPDFLNYIGKPEVKCYQYKWRL